MRAVGRPGSRTRRCCRRRPRSRATSAHRAARRSVDSVSPRSGALVQCARRPLCWNDSKMRSRSSGACRCPCRDGDRSSASSRHARITTVATVGRELDRVGQQVENHLVEPQLVGLDEDVGRVVEPQRDRRAGGPFAHQREAVLERRQNREGRRSSSMRPASTFDRSSMSLSSSSRWRPDSRMSRRYSSWLSLRSPNMRSRGPRRSRSPR